MKPVGIYIHTPFCASKCPYCDFYSGTPSAGAVAAYTSALLREISRYKGRGIAADTVYFGGGTPPLLGAENIVRIIGGISDAFNISDDAEITLEANPSFSLCELFKAVSFTQTPHCVNRISLGMQSANEHELRFLGRRHSNSQVSDAVLAAREAGIENISLDLMLALPRQTEEELAASVRFAHSLAPSHISAYILKVEDNTPFGHAGIVLPEDDSVCGLYTSAVRLLGEMGYAQYEISNFSKRGMESRHNLKYWNAEEYIGFGPSAHSFFEGKRFFYPRDTESFISSPQAIFDGDGGGEEEYIMLRLRLTEGLVFSDYRDRFGEDVPADYLKRAGELSSRGLLSIDSRAIRLTTEGFLVSNSIIGYILG
ncbi:MAG: radical SAM family heme chaperone HemW [Oscillospiraceae bacterium]|jgi:oxygen-independent coproporphyrinogen-3 oxidase|nr:radical SAM family heme chaperone HemW [Oscillospiraceae bacterium]